MAKFSSIKFKGIKYGNPLIGVPTPWSLAQMPQDIWTDSGMVFLPMTGLSFSAATYPKLALVYPSLVLPDMRAQAIRGWDNGLGVDAGRTLLSLQGDAMRKITGTLSGIKSNIGLGPTHGTGAFVPDAVADGNKTLYGAQQAASNGTLIGGSFDSSLVVPTAPEVRIKTIAFNFITRAA